MNDYKLLWENSEKRLAGANDWAMGVEAELATAKERIKELEAVVNAALETANGRWSEWGGRAMSVAEILEKAKGGTP